MECTRVQVGNLVYNLAEGQPVDVGVGDTLRVFYSFSYIVPQTVNASIWGSLYRYTLGILDRSSNAQTKSSITLEASPEWQTYQGQIDIVIGSIDSGLWGLIVELPGYDGAEAKIDNCIQVAAAGGITDLLPVLTMVMMMGMVMPMMEEE